MNIGTKIALRRKEAGLSQEELASRLHISRQAVSRWETGDAMPETDKVIQLSRILRVSTDYLLLDEIEIPEPAAGLAQKNLRLERRRRFRIATGIVSLTVGFLTALGALILAGIWAMKTNEWQTNLGRFGTGLLQTWRFGLLVWGVVLALAGTALLIREYVRKD